MTTAQNDSNLAGLRAALPAWYERISDPHLRADLQRIEERIYSYADDTLSGWLGMAHEFAAAKPKLLEIGQWKAWVEDRFSGFIGRDSADKLAEIGQIEQSELAALRKSYFQHGTGIKAIAAYLAAPDEVKEQVQQGKVGEKPNMVTAADITRAVKEADEARKRAEEAEARAQRAAARFQEQVEEAVHEAELRGQLELQKATAALQQEIDAARHQSDLRSREVEQAKQQIQQAQSEYQRAVAEAASKATAAERERLEREHAAKMEALQKQLQQQQQKLEEQQKAARAVQRQYNELNERLTQARDAEAVKARFGILAAHLVTTLDDALKQLPDLVDAQYFENHERTLLDGVIKRCETVAERLKELRRSSMTVVDAG